MLSMKASVPSVSLTRALGGVFGRGGVCGPASVSLSLLSNPSDIGVRGNIFSVYDIRDLACAPPGCSLLPLRTGVFERLVDRGEPGCHRGDARYELMNCDVDAGHCSGLMPAVPNTPRENTTSTRQHSSMMAWKMAMCLWNRISSLSTMFSRWDCSRCVSRAMTVDCQIWS